MYSLIRGVLVFAALAPLVAAGQVASLSSVGALDSDAVHKRASLVPPPQIMEPLLSPQAPLTPLTRGEMPAQPPRVTFSGGVLTVDSENSTLSDILLAVHQLTGADFEPMPQISERTAVHLSGSASDVVSDLLRGSQFGYVLISALENPDVLRTVVLIAKEAGAASHTIPLSMSARAMAEPLAAPTSSESVNPDSTAATSSAPLATEQLPATTQQQIVLPDPVQVMERANLQNRDPSQTPVNPAAQYMQELYRLRLQQQNQTTSAQPSPASPQQ
jgi:hypothetical protein